MKYIEANKLKKEHGLKDHFKNVNTWILRDPFIYKYFERFDRNSKVLELGAGRGGFLKALDEMGFKNVSGLDIGNYLEKENEKYRFDVIDLNTEKLPYEDNSLDVVAGFQVIEHLENYFLVQQEVARVLKPGGMFIFSIPNHMNLFYRIKYAITGNITGFEVDNNHLLFLTRNVFKKTYLQNFDLVRMYYDKGPIPMLGRLNFLPFVNFPPKVKVLPRCEAFAYKVCYFLKKKN
jgi:2-polyprenyl-3-methyl-5-hydroxy-6-metoxy-1,4-benzoquinol methylase|tara:strand:+ start:44059 stop:44760 length:702 start_codon:yes stop_codon:yes gene_type:complete